METKSPSSVPSLRGGSVSRLEGFSDAVFGFALTILVVSLNAPQTFGELQRTVRGVVPFALCFSLLVLIWYKHYRFFREYGLEDKTTVFLNSILLFTVLFYVYPLRLLFNLWVGFLIHDPNVTTMVTTWGQVAQIIALFGIGFAAIMLVFCLLYTHAYRQRVVLSLAPREIASTRVNMLVNLLFTSIGLVSALIALLVHGRHAFISVWLYLFIIPIVLVLEPILRRRTLILT